MLVLGDSILWGQGLKPERKSWYQVKAWLERTTGRRVAERIEAHSGTVIELPVFGIRGQANQDFLAVHFRRAGNSLEESLGQTLQNEIVSASFRKERIVPGNDYYSGRK